MIGLEKEIELRRTSVLLGRKEPMSYTNIAKIINKTYNTAVNKTKSASFTVEEAVKIYEGLGFKSKNDFEAFKYLFTEQDNQIVNKDVTI
jgi:hypothetical protein